ncbi:hypothetical protein APS67_000959 [Streptomyces sp. AVP053U2]|nr:hypothetical protein APS67_000959 [Streptomyces sp. AVP053U2]
MWRRPDEWDDVAGNLSSHSGQHPMTTLYAHVRPRLQRDVIDTLSTALDSPVTAETVGADGGEPPPCTTVVRQRCR